MEQELNDLAIKSASDAISVKSDLIHFLFKLMKEKSTALLVVTIIILQRKVLNS